MAKTQHTTHIGIYGGSFNPIHTGHIALARTLLRLTSLDEIWFMVSPLNPFKRATEDLLADNLRLKLTQLALEGEPRLVASDFEFGLPKPSYTYDTLRKLTETYPQNHFTLIMGADNWLAFDRWKDHEKSSATIPSSSIRVTTPLSMPPHFHRVSPSSTHPSTISTARLSANAWQTVAPFTVL